MIDLGLNQLVRALAGQWRLSAREGQVLASIARGATGSKTIAGELGIAGATVDRHLESISRKSGLAGRAEMAAFLLRAFGDLLAKLQRVEVEGFGKNMRATIVEDDADLAALMGEVLSAAGFAIETASSSTPELAVSLLRNQTDVVLIDYVLPGPSGLELARRTVEGGIEAASVVIVTGFPDKFVLEGDARQFDVVFKPIEPADLVRVAITAAVQTRIRRRLWQDLQAG